MRTNSLFRPTTTDFSAENSDSAPWNVTVPQCTEIIRPAAQLLEQLLPVGAKPTSTPPQASSGSAFVDAMKKAQNQRRTQNNAEAYASTTSATLDAFSSLNENSPAQLIHMKLAKSWKESPDLTLRIIWNMRSIPEGHNNKPGFYRAFGWLYKHHPRTAIENLRCITEGLCQRKIEHKPTKIDEEGFALVDPEDKPTEQTIKVSHGYFKDLLNIVILALHNELTDSSLREFSSLKTDRIRYKTRTKKEWESIKAAKQQQNQQLGEEEAKRRREAESQREASAQAQEAKAARREQREANFALIKHKLQYDKPFLALYATVAQIFAGELAKDIILLKRIENATEDEAFHLELELSNAAKWAPTIGSFHDRATNMATAIALVLRARGYMFDLSLPLSAEMTQEQANTLRGYYRRWILSPLRRYLDVPEVKMSAGQWNKINYERVPDKCMEKNQSKFLRHDADRFNKFLRDIEAGKCKVRHETLLPHEILMSALGLAGNRTRPIGGFRKTSPEMAIKRDTEIRVQETAEKVAGALWNSLVEQIRSSGTLESSLAIVDVSGSMGSLDGPRLQHRSTSMGGVSPIFPAVALGMLLATIAKPPFNDMFITFSATPELLSIPPGDLAEQARWMSRTDWTMNTDYEAVFLKLILPTAVQNKVKPEDMVKRLFVFSDMQFDESLTESQSAGARWETTHDRIVKAFQAAGYKAPEIVYWNLSGYETQPVLKNTPGAALVTGFAANMMKLFMKGKISDPMSVMETALSKPCFAPLKVYD